MPSKKQRITVYLGTDEYRAIQESAEKTGFSLSTYCKKVCLGFPVPSMEHRQAVRDILKANADLGRLGGLFKLALSGAEGSEKFALQKTLRDIEAGIVLLKTAARKIT